jgi:ion channel-forming bestrophin family protein
VIAYNPKDWFTFIFRLHKSDTIRKLFPMMIAIGFYSWLIAYFELNYLERRYFDHLKNLTILHNLLGFVISLLLVFRTNTAYERWWEGRKLWGGLVNVSRTLALKINTLAGENGEAEKRFFARIIPLFSQVLKSHLQSEKVRLALDEEEHPELKTIDAGKHIPNQVASIMIARIYRLHQSGKINGYELQTLNQELQAFTDICGACERIKNTPIPFSYSLFIKKFIFFYVMTMPLGFVFSLGYFVIPAVIFVFYVLTSIEIIAEEIEDPFGGDSNDLPLHKLSENIGIHVREILQ